VQLWVNLPAALKLTPPRYQAITKDELTYDVDVPAPRIGHQHLDVA
jgi:redox-sensitive bicupin YhaK (pirin superfamily)